MLSVAALFQLSLMIVESMCVGFCMLLMLCAYLLSIHNSDLNGVWSLFRSVTETRRKYEEKHAKAEELRNKVMKERAERVEHLNSKVSEVIKITSG